MTAELLRSLHVPGRPLVLPNAWDAGTARLVVEAGFPVVATSSAAVAESLGYTDHEGGQVDEMFAAVRRITRAVDVPVTVDAEAGYGLPPAELVSRLLDAGAVGCNLEDTDHAGGGLTPVGKQAAYLAEVRAAAGQDLVVNARVDVFVRGGDTVLDEGVERARAYLAAGADCVYPILIRSTDLLRSFVAEVDGPVNALRLPELPDVAATGVARVSLGSGLWRRTQAMLRETLQGLV
ncbi:isocitrate lyase/phosphoenolpyruvate mutase family protein [Actinophytocola sp.]|uniref:isocitrate lyase/PEP mutase family protein n=1 Tax=Actinophytocola sp. TaxID=1872138 RepID=UPI002ED40F6E